MLLVVFVLRITSFIHSLLILIPSIEIRPVELYRLYRLFLYCIRQSYAVIRA